jgi:thymidylate synthase (FAD)
MVIKSNFDAQSVYETRRPTVENLERILGTAMPVLDHGFIRVVDYMGNDEAIVQAARVSYGKGTKSTREDTALIRYLLRHRHTTPFEMCEIKLHVKLPIFVARQWIRHRTANVNEYSARYSVLDREFYLPAAEHLGAQSLANHQGREQHQLTQQQSVRVLEILRSDANHAYDRYLELLNEGEDGHEIDPDVPGLARELARMNLTLNFYTQWFWKIDLHNLLHFLQLRIDPHAQLEIRLYAETISKIVEMWTPRAFAAFVEYRLNAVELSATAIGVLRRMLSGEHVTFQDSGLTKREWQDFEKLFPQT